jgi:hypothetical protein
VAAIGILLVGIGAYLMYDAVKNASPTPVTNAKSSLAAVSTSTPTPAKAAA